MNAASVAIRIDPISNAAHWQHFAALLRRYAAADLDSPGTSSIWQDLQDLPARYAAPQGGAVLVWPWHTNTGANATASPAATEPIGCGAFARTREPGLCEIKRLYLLPEWRGQGLGRTLIQTVLRHAAAAGYNRAGLSTWAHNHSGLALYRALGFGPVAPFKDHPNTALIYLGRPLPTPPFSVS